MSLDEEEEKFDDEDIPESGAVFSFGDELPEKFWIGKGKTIVQVSCGQEHTCVLSDAGKLYTYGKNNWGQLGVGDTQTSDQPRFVKDIKSERITHIACGRNHTLAYSATHKLFGFGCNNEGQVGEGLPESVNVPTHNPFWKEQLNIKMLSGGGEFSALLTESGVLYMWGSNDLGQLGLGESIAASGQPQKVELPGKCIFVSCGTYHAGAIVENGNLLMWGEAESGKLGLTNQADNDRSNNNNNDEEDDEDLENFKPVYKPQVVPDLSSVGVSMISCGNSHTLAVTRDQKVYAWGEGSLGQLGLGVRQLQVNKPTPLSKNVNSLLKVKEVSAGECHSSLVLVDGSFFTFGDITHNKLGLPPHDNMNKFAPTRVKRLQHLEVLQAKCGGCHTVLLARRDATENNLLSTSVLSWTSLDRSTTGSFTASVENGHLDDLNDTNEYSHKTKRTRALMREKRRKKDEDKDKLSATLPALQISPRGDDKMSKTLNLRENLSKENSEESEPKDEKSPTNETLVKKNDSLPPLSQPNHTKKEEEPPTQAQEKSKPNSVVPEPRKRKKSVEKPETLPTITDMQTEEEELVPQKVAAVRSAKQKNKIVNEQIPDEQKPQEVKKSDEEDKEEEKKPEEKIVPEKKDKKPKEPIPTPTPTATTPEEPKPTVKQRNNKKANELVDEKVDEKQQPATEKKDNNKTTKPTTNDEKPASTEEPADETPTDEKNNEENKENGEDPTDEQVTVKKGCGGGNRRCVIL